MYIFMTNGTHDYLKRIQERHESEKMILMNSNISALLLHETAGETYFNEPRQFEVIDHVGDLSTDEGFVVMNHFPTTEEGSPLLEHSYKKRDRFVEEQAGFIASRILRPVRTNTYVVLTMWESEAFYNIWKNSPTFEQAHPQNILEKNIGLDRNVFASPAYVSTHTIFVEEADEELSVE